MTADMGSGIKNNVTLLTEKGIEVSEEFSPMFLTIDFGNIDFGNFTFSLSDILNYIQLVSVKENDLLNIQSSFVSETLQPNPTTDGDKQPVSKKPRKIKVPISNKIMTVQEYKAFLTNQLLLLDTARPDEEIELDFETL